MTKVYKYKDDSFYDGYEDCPCCSGMLFEVYNAVGWNQNGSALCSFDLYSQVLVEYLTDGDMDLYPDFNPYDMFTLQELIDVCERRGIILEEVKV